MIGKASDMGTLNLLTRKADLGDNVKTVWSNNVPTVNEWNRIRKHLGVGLYQVIFEVIIGRCL